MSQQSLQDVLKSLQEDFGDTIEKAREGAPTGSWDVDLPEELEYRCTIVGSEYVAAKSSGKPQAKITFEVNEPEAYAGAKFQGYYQIPPENEASSRKLAELLGSLVTDGGSWGNDTEGFVGSWVDTSIVVVTNKWGEQNDRIGVRYVNADRGQTLRTDIKPPKPRRSAPADLRPEINIPKEETAAPAEQATVTPPVVESAPAPAQTTSLPGGVNLPPGLRG